VFLPYQLLLVSPLLVPVWVAGWWRLAHDPALRPWRAFAFGYVWTSTTKGSGRPHPWTDDRPTLSSTRRPARGAVLRQPEGDLADGVDTGVHVIDGLGQALPERAVRHGQCSVEP
jgi:hypothetical protein